MATGEFRPLTEDAARTTNWKRSGAFPRLDLVLLGTDGQAHGWRTPLVCRSRRRRQVQPCVSRESIRGLRYLHWFLTGQRATPEQVTAECLRSGSETLACAVSRFMLRDWVQGRFGDKLATINAGIEREGAFNLFSLRLVPVFPFFVINLLMGLTRMRPLTFFWVSQIGMLAGTVVYVNAGRQKVNPMFDKIDQLCVKTLRTQPVGRDTGRMPHPPLTKVWSPAKKADKSALGGIK
jgi:hypothetical protein